MDARHDLKSFCAICRPDAEMSMMFSSFSCSGVLSNSKPLLLTLTSQSMMEEKKSQNSTVDREHEYEFGNRRP